MKPDSFYSEIKAKLEAARKLVSAYETILDGAEKIEAEVPPKSAKPAIEGTGLREAIRSMLKSYPSGLTSVKLVEKLKDSGFTVVGKTPLSSRVHIELSGLKKRGEILKRGDKYILADN